VVRLRRLVFRCSDEPGFGDRLPWPGPVGPVRSPGLASPRVTAHVAQGIERRFPKPCVAGSNPAVGTGETPAYAGVSPGPVRHSPPLFAAHRRFPPVRSEPARNQRAGSSGPLRTGGHVHVWWQQGRPKWMEPTMARLERLMTVEQVCDYLEVSRDTWDKWRSKGTGPQARRLPNGSLRITEDDLAAWVDELVAA